MARDVIIACDFAGSDEVFDFLALFTQTKPFVKIGMELFYSAGPDIVKKLKERGHRVFLDLKLHDIPTTVRKSMSVLAGLGADICNLHAAGGSEMMRAALEGLTRPGCPRPLLIAVTQLTSTSQETLRDELRIDAPIDQIVASYALNAKKSGLDGVVCSPLEAGLIHEKCGANFITVTPGVRFECSDTGDQKRVTTPAAARALGSDFIVVGRPITATPDPLAAYLRARAEFLGA